MNAMTHQPDDEEEDLLQLDAFAPQPEVRAFARAELIACPACERANAPTRMQCLYCGAAMPSMSSAGDLRRPALRVLEAWEQGYNVVLLARSETAAELPRDALVEAAQFVRLEPEQLGRMLAARTPLPLARTADREEAALVERKLTPLGLAVEIVADETLAVETRLPQRVRRFEFDETGVQAWASAEGSPQHVAWSELMLLVVGRISRRQIEVEERRVRGTDGNVVDTREFYDDEGVLDLYATDAALHWRVKSDGFDYTCLGANKSLLAGENFTRLGLYLSARAPNAIFDSDYTMLRHLFQAAWPVAEATSSGLRRAGRGRVNREAITNVSNEVQFTRYSRLRQYYALRRAAPHTHR